MEEYKLRIDKWLWAVRIFKTRKITSDACKSGKVKINNRRIKPSYLIKVGEKITVIKDIIKYEYAVTGLIEKRVSSKIAITNYIDNTPDQELNKHKSSLVISIPRRKKGEGRPTKKERRELEKIKRKF